MPLVTSTEMFKKAYAGGYAIGAFNVNNMEMIQAIVEAADECKSPVILQVSAGARKYANPVYLRHLVQAAVETTNIPLVMHLDHGADFEICKASIDGGFTSVMIDASSKPWEENIAITKKVVEYAHDHGVVVEAELGKLAGVEDDVKVEAHDALFTSPDEVEEFTSRTGIDSLAIAIGTSHGAYKFKPGQDPKLRLDILEEVGRRLPASPSSSTARPAFRRTRWRSSTNSADICPTRSAFPNPSCARRRKWRCAKSISIPTSAFPLRRLSANILRNIPIISIPVSTWATPAS